MLTLYSAATINGRRAAIALAECGLPHEIHILDLAKGEQRHPDFLRLNPNGAIPVLVTADGRPITQSAAILFYCAETSGRLLPTDPGARIKTLEWFAQAITDAGPASSMLFQLALTNAADPAPFEQRFLKHCAHADRQLQGQDYLAGAFSIADIALYPIIIARGALVEAAPGLAALKAWAARIAARPATAAAIAALPAA